MSSWKALSWAKDRTAGSPVAKLVLLLLAERADERFSCYPGRALLSRESEASVSGVKLALRQLEAAGLITTVPQKRPNGGQTTNRYFLNHPEAPHMQAIESLSRGGQSVTGGGSVSDRGGVTECPPRGVTECPPRTSQLKTQPPPQKRARRVEEEGASPEPESTGQVLDDLPAPWGVGPRRRAALSPLITAAVAAGWSPARLREYLSANPDGVKNGYAVMRARLLDLPPAPRSKSKSAPTKSSTKPAAPKWCGTCREIDRMIPSKIHEGRMTRCPACNPREQKGHPS